MPSNWSIVDATFPTFRGDEQPREQIGKLLNYMRVLTEQLQYSLDNLDTSNWNAAALQEFSDETSGAAVELVNKLAAQLEQVKIEVASVVSRMAELSDLPDRVSGIETDITYIERDIADHEVRIGEAEQSIENAQSDIDALQLDVSTLGNRLADVNDIVKELSGMIQLGGTDKTVNIVGTVLINGVPIEQIGGN